MSKDTENITGSLAVRKDVTVGGKLISRHNTEVHGDLIVKGALRASQINGKDMGMFATEEDLKAAVPNPKVGMYAIVGDNFPATLYNCKNAGEWTSSSEQVNYTSPESQLEDMIDSAVGQVLTSLGILDSTTITDLKQSLTSEISDRVQSDKSLAEKINKLSALIIKKNDTCCCGHDNEADTKWRDALLGISIDTAENILTIGGVEYQLSRVSGSGSGQANPSISYKYEDVTISRFTYGSIPYSGGVATPTLEWTVKKVKYIDGVRTDEVETVSGNLNDENVSAVFSGTNIDPTTGVCTAPANDNGGKYTASITSITIFGQTFPLTATKFEITQLKKNDPGSLVPGELELEVRYQNTVLTLAYDVIPAEGSDEQRTVSPSISWSQEKVTLNPDGTALNTETITIVTNPESLTSIKYYVGEEEIAGGKVTANTAPEGTGTRNISTVVAKAVINGKDAEATCVVRQNMKAASGGDERQDNPIVVSAVSGLKYNGSDRSLVTVNGGGYGVVAYALGSNLTNEPSGAAYREGVPVGKNAGDYYVWWQCSGNITFKPASGKLKVTIQKGDNSIRWTTPPPTTHTAGQEFTVVAQADHGTVKYYFNGVESTTGKCTPAAGTLIVKAKTICDANYESPEIQSTVEVAAASGGDTPGTDKSPNAISWELAPPTSARVGVPFTIKAVADHAMIMAYFFNGVQINANNPDGISCTYVPTTAGQLTIKAQAIAGIEYEWSETELKTITVSPAADEDEKQDNPVVVSAVSGLSYDGNSHDLLNISGAIGSVSWKFGEDATNEPDDEWITYSDSSKPQKTNAGTYYIWWYAMGDATRKPASGVKTVQIAKAANPIRWIIEPESVTVGDEMQARAKAFYSTTIQYTFTIGGNTTTSYTGIFTPETAGILTVKAKAICDANYEASEIQSTVEVTAASGGDTPGTGEQPITIDWEIEPPTSATVGVPFTVKAVATNALNVLYYFNGAQCLDIDGNGICTYKPTTAGQLSIKAKAIAADGKYANTPMALIQVTAPSSGGNTPDTGQHIYYGTYDGFPQNIASTEGLTEVTVGTLGKTAVSYNNQSVIILIPISSSLVAKQDNGFGGKATFDESDDLGCNGNKTVTINGKQYKVYGQYFMGNAKCFIYID